MKLLFILGTFGLFGFLVSAAEGNVDTPFDFETNGLQVNDIEVDSSKFEIILQVDVFDNPATLEITFDRDFFDSRYLNTDDDYVIVANGDMVYYEELENNSEFRTITFNLNQGTNEVEIFGTHMNGITFETSSQAKLQGQTPSDVTEDKENSQLEQLIEENEKL